MNKWILSIALVWISSIWAIGQNIINIPVSGACGMCKERIEGIALSTIGVNKAKYLLDKQELTIEVGSFFDKKELTDKLLKAGHDNDGQIATKENYEALHECCHYREEENSVRENEDDPKPIGIVMDLNGSVFEKLDNGELLPVIGATLNWKGTSQGVITDMNGEFSIPLIDQTKDLVVNYVGYLTDTISVSQKGFLKIVLDKNIVLDAIEIKHKKRTTEISYLDPIKIQSISQKELLKAACCNLAESFDTTPAIDASFTDAITGTRKIEMLGLAGPYVQITRENIPDTRGLAAVSGLAYTPGPWMEGMQLNMGAGSVVNGFESLTGQINLELKKPCHEDNLYLNGYANQAGRYEFNSFTKHEVNENWSVANLLHTSARTLRRDRNNDGFLDVPLTKQIGLINRWKYTDNKGQEGQLGFRVSLLDNLSGQNDFRLNESDRTKVWGADMNTSRVEMWAKRGIVNLDSPHKTLGFQFSGVYHVQDAKFGLRRYDASQKSIYFNSIYQDKIGNLDHQFRAGASFQWDNYQETVVETEYLRNEWVPGVFTEYTYKGSERFSLLVGLRGDYHNNFGFFATPRLNVRYSPQEATVFRLSAGRGQRTESIFAENIGLFASSRTIRVLGNNPNTPYGLQAEVAWNVGFSITQDFKILDRNHLLSFDLNRINFENQIVVDFDQSPREVLFYNLQGQSFSNSGQLQFELDMADWLDVRLAYRYNDVRTTFGETLLRKPLASPHRAFANFAVELGKGWKWDYTINWQSSARLPSTDINPEQYVWEKESPDFFMSNTQVSKLWANNLELYLGAENLFDYHLHRPIIASDQPFSPYFDSSLVWGPIMGINVYAGFRYNL